jgi:hypothetical protein
MTSCNCNERVKATLRFLKTGMAASTIQVVSRERVRRRITFFLLILLAAVALRGGEGKDVALKLGPIVALLVIAMRFYFGQRKENAAKWRRISHLDLRDRRDSNPAPPA